MSATTPGRLGDKVAVVTGGSRGIGRAIAERFVTEGAHVFAASRSGETVPGAVAVSCDVSSEADVSALMAQVRDAHGRLDVLVNNAAVEYEATIEDTTVEQWDSVMAINVRGPFLTAKHALPLMRAAGAGSIVNLASVDGFWAEPNLAVYNTSKGAVQALTRALAIDHGPENIRTNAICPSYVLTDMLEQFFDSQDDPQRARNQAASIHPLQRMSVPADIANLAMWLASDESSFANGQSYVLDGGLTAGRTVDLSRIVPAEVRDV